MLKDEIARKRNQAFLEALKMLPSEFNKLLSKARRTLEKFAPPSGRQQTFGSDGEMLHYFIKQFAHTFRTLFEAKTSAEDEIIIQSLSLNSEMKLTLKQELEHYGTKALPHFPEPDTVFTGGIEIKSRAAEDDLLEGTEEAGSPLSAGYQRVERLASEMRLRVTALELEDPTDEALRDQMPPGYRSNIKDLNGAVSLLTRMEVVSLLTCTRWVNLAQRSLTSCLFGRHALTSAIV